MGKKKHYNGQNRQHANQQAREENVFRTTSGFEYRLEAKNLQDMRLLDAMVEMEDQSTPYQSRITSMIKVIRMMLGEDQKEKFYAHVVKLYGWADPEAVGRELKDIIDNLNGSKKK